MLRLNLNKVKLSTFVRVKIVAMKFTNIIIGALSSVLVFSACKKDETPDRADLVIPSNYDGTNFETNAVTELAVRAQLANITKEAQKGRTSGVIVNYADLQNLYTLGTPSLKNLSTTYFSSILDGSTQSGLNELAKASGNTYTIGDIASQGGTFGGYLFDEFGLEYEQIIDKGQFGAVLYKHAVDLLSSPIDATTADKVLAIFGSNPSFPNSNNASKHAIPDAQAAVYAARRTDSSDVNGFYFKMKKAFIKLQAAGKAGDAYAPEQKEAADEIKLLWEKVNAATIINYCIAANKTLTSTELTDAQKGSALHALSECIGFAAGWKTVSSKKISDTQIEQIITLLNAPSGANPAVYKFVTERETEVSKLSQIINLLKGVYSFSDAEISSFEVNWVSSQNR